MEEKIKFASWVNKTLEVYWNEEEKSKIKKMLEEREKYSRLFSMSVKMSLLLLPILLIPIVWYIKGEMNSFPLTIFNLLFLSFFNILVWLKMRKLEKRIKKEMEKISYQIYHKNH